MNIAARLPGLSQGGELIFTEEVHNDPEIQEFLTKSANPEAVNRFTANVKGFDEAFTMWRVKV